MSVSNKFKDFLKESILTESSSKSFDTSKMMHDYLEKIAVSLRGKKIQDYDFRYGAMSGEWTWNNAKTKDYVYAALGFDGDDALLISDPDGDNIPISGSQNFIISKHLTFDLKKDTKRYLDVMTKVLKKRNP